MRHRGSPPAPPQRSCGSMSDFAGRTARNPGGTARSHASCCCRGVWVEALPGTVCLQLVEIELADGLEVSQGGPASGSTENPWEYRKGQRVTIGDVRRKAGKREEPWIFSSSSAFSSWP